MQPWLEYLVIAVTGYFIISYRLYVQTVLLLCKFTYLFESRWLSWSTDNIYEAKFGSSWQIFTVTKHVTSFQQQMHESIQISLQMYIQSLFCSTSLQAIFQPLTINQISMSTSNPLKSSVGIQLKRIENRGTGNSYSQYDLQELIELLLLLPAILDDSDELLKDYAGMQCLYCYFCNENGINRSFEDCNCIYYWFFQLKLYLITLFIEQNIIFRMKITQSNFFTETQPKFMTQANFNPRSPLNVVIHNSIPPTQMIKATNILPNPLYPLSSTYRMITHYIGRPFEIRIPTNQMKYLQAQIKQLRQKCDQLQKKCNSGENYKGKQIQREMESTFYEISRSTKNIEQQISSAIHFQNVCQTVESKQGENEDGDEDGDKADENIDQFKVVKQELQSKQRRINYLEDNNRRLEEELSKIQAQIDQIEQKNQELKKQIDETESKQVQNTFD